MYLVNVDYYFRRGREIVVKSAPSTLELSAHWWSDARRLDISTKFLCEIDSYLNPNDVLLCGDIINVACKSVIDILGELEVEIDVYETVWRNPSEEFLQKEYQVFRMPVTQGAIDMKLSKYSFDEDGKPYHFFGTAFHEQTPAVFRPHEQAHRMFCTQRFVSLCKRQKVSGINFREVE